MVFEIAPRIVVDSAIHFGKPVITGTRMPVDVLIGKLASGMSEDEVADEIEVTVDDVPAALRYAADVLSHEELPSKRLADISPDSSPVLAELSRLKPTGGTNERDVESFSPL